MTKNVNYDSMCEGRRYNVSGTTYLKFVPNVTKIVTFFPKKFAVFGESCYNAIGSLYEIIIILL